MMMVKTPSRAKYHPNEFVLIFGLQFIFMSSINLSGGSVVVEVIASHSSMSCGGAAIIVAKTVSGG